MKKLLGFFFRLLLTLLLLAILAGGGLIGALTALEYRPAARETLSLSGQGEEASAPGDTLTVLSWNIGYCGLGATADFFMDGGKNVRQQTRDQVLENLQAVEDLLREEDADVVFLQEVDRNSMRSYGIDQTVRLQSAFPDSQAAFASNFKVAFVPYPVPPIGRVDSGLLTLSRMTADRAERISLPCPFSWPIRTANLKRCLLVERVPLEKTGSELVLINLHLEAYDDGAGKREQTKMLFEFMQAEYDKGNYVIAGGDFNQSFDTSDLSGYPLQREDLWQPGLIETGIFGDLWQFCMDTSVPTCRSLDRPLDLNDPHFQYYVIDGFIVSANLKVEELTTISGDFAHSDHNPVRIVIRLEPEEE